MLRLPILCLLMVSVALLASRSAEAKSFHVSPDGDDAAPGSPTKPLRTISKAADLARAGDTILVRGGVYPESVVMRYSGQKDKPITLKSSPGETAVIQPGQAGKEPPGHGVLLQAREGYQKPIGWIVVERLEIRHGWDGIKIYNAQNIVIRGCHIHDNWNQGVLGNGNRVLIEGNIIASNGTNPEPARNLLHGIYATGSEFTIINNLIYANTAYGIQVAAYDYNKEHHAGPEYADAKNWLIANNTLALNRNRAGIVIWMEGVENCIIQNNIFYKNGGVNGILFYSQQGQRHRIRHNLFYPPGENLVATEDNSYEAVGNQQADPRFVDPATHDFHLAKGSPAIDSGWEQPALVTDFTGSRRPQGQGIDIGAYEFSSQDGATCFGTGP